MGKSQLKYLIPLAMGFLSFYLLGATCFFGVLLFCWSDGLMQWYNRNWRL